VKVEIATLESLAGQCRAEAAETTARHTTLSSSVDASVLEGWTDSQAAARFTELYEQWRLSAQGSATRSPAWAVCSAAWRRPTSSTRRTWRPASVR
jgi:hypothetical protein